ncbi:MAG TPA: GTP cyclohydrolase MptA [Solirubrobacterales bacterium]|jgi:GTP cyclohydrolase I/GTP cyclohydrolase-4|nr:GTP cyclohydrolase MptA [Solirubrobacterales bacterium]
MEESATSVQTVSRDAQAAAPVTRVSLSRVGVTGVEKVIRVCGERTENGSAADRTLEAGLYHAELECLVDLNPEQAGVHMSRFEEVVNEAIDEVVLQESLKAEGLAAHIAERVRERQGGLRAEVRISARYPETKPAPVSELPTQEIYTLFGTAVASERGTRTLIGVEAQGMTACPCAQGLVETGARERLAEHGYTPEQISEIVGAVPIATHNQRGIGRLYVGRPEESGIDIDARDLLAIVEASMSSEIYELLKRSDERAVVEKAHANPRFVEDCVREMIRRVTDAFPDLAGDAFVQARQENLETIHRHNVIAERYGLIAEIASELTSGEHSRHHTTMREWLEAPASS